MKITKIKIFNFKKFRFLEVDFKDNLNVIIGDNEYNTLEKLDHYLS